MAKNITGKELKNIGFNFVKEYNHDQFKTLRYKNGVIEFELTYENEILVSSDMTMEEVNCFEVTIDELRIITEIFNR